MTRSLPLLQGYQGAELQQDTKPNKDFALLCLSPLFVLSVWRVACLQFEVVFKNDTSAVTERVGERDVAQKGLPKHHRNDGWVIVIALLMNELSWLLLQWNKHNSGIRKLFSLFKVTYDYWWAKKLKIIVFSRHNLILLWYETGVIFRGVAHSGPWS